ncbi:aldo-keto reductase-like protein [Cryomyces antarcticus]
MDSNRSTSKLQNPAQKTSFIYGTAWKKSETARLVTEALAAGFTAIDTAAQPKHYQEPLVGEAVRSHINSGKCNRDQIYVQTKFTPPSGQDLSNMPYAVDDPLEAQIEASVSSSLQNFRTTEDGAKSGGAYIDCLLLHSPLRTMAETLQAWTFLEKNYLPHRVRRLGISNISLPALKRLWEESTVKPAVVQNRFYAATEYDTKLRAFCRDKGIVYQSFWTLTGTPQLSRSEPVASLARAAGISGPVALYSLVMSLDIVVLNGTTSAERMREDLEGVACVEAWAESNADDWARLTAEFARIVEGKATPERTTPPQISGIRCAALWYVYVR